ncbi:MAG: hydantoinase/oxoprolinase family protein [Chloroflexi bacterium]|nr:hydantoinase/oxoprolinase family protein [Chloroflexota bacterium]
MANKIKLGVDVGGTFTDFVLLDEERSSFTVGKCLTTPQDPSIGVLEGARQLLNRAGIPLSDVVNAVHGTTLVTNTIIERKGARTGLIATKGWRDTLEIGRDVRYDLYDLFIERPEPLVPRYLRKEVTERLNKDGVVLIELDREEVTKAAEELAQEGVVSVGVCLFHAYRNPAHEIAIQEILREGYPQFHVTLSSEVAPEIREYERTSTTVANAYVQPLIKGYLASLESQLRQMGLEGNLYVMLSSGGITTVRAAEQFPIRLIESGPAGGAIAAAFYGSLVGGEQDLISFDMGGTTAKMCLINKGEPSHANEFEAARVRRFKKGSGFVLKVPVIEMIEIGAGGGSMAHLDTMGLLKVGPESSGATPGPACYGQGGSEPTVTDADLVLGYLNEGYFLGGDMVLDRAAAERAITEHAAKPLGTGLLQAAEGIFNVVNENMASATRIYAAEKGHDPRAYALVAFGGAGPVHAYALGRLLKIRRVVCPLAAGTTSALGFLVAPMSLDFVRSYVTRLDSLDWGHLGSLFADMERSGRSMLEDAEVAPEEMRFACSAEMRYVGQGFEITVPIPHAKLDGGQLEEIRQNFYAAYEKLYGRYLTDVPIEALTWRVVASGPALQVDLRVHERHVQDYPGGVKGHRGAYFSEAKGFVTCTVYDRYSLLPGMEFEGPAIVEERESTTVVGPSARARIDEYLNLIMEIDYK